MNYGLPYKGSKSKIAAKVIKALPSGEVFVDLFAGGCAITHAAMMSGKYKRFIANDITALPQLFVDGINGRYRHERRWISRDTFFAEKDSDDYVRICWSFGNDGRTYMYGSDIEPYKHACWYAVVWDDMREFIHLCPEVSDDVVDALIDIPVIGEGSPAVFKARRIALGRAVVCALKRIGTMGMVESNPLYRSCHWKGGKYGQSLQSLESLESLQSLQSLESLQSDYRDVKIPTGAVVYCDIPYKGTNGYDNTSQKSSFDYEAFYEWCVTRNFPVYVSEYYMPEDRFEEVGNTQRTSTMSANGCEGKVTERLFVQKRHADVLNELILTP